MTKAPIIDRLELTRRKFSRVEDVTTYDGIEDFPDTGIHGDTCPNCGQKTLLHESGCAKCPSCGWSACG